MIHEISLLIKLFIENAIIHGICTEGTDYKTGNKAHDKIVKIINKIKLIDPCFNQLIPLLKHENMSVKLWAASCLLPFYKENAEKALEEISKKKGLVAFSAGITLKEWKEGNLKLDFWDRNSSNNYK